MTTQTKHTVFYYNIIIHFIIKVNNPLRTNDKHTTSLINSTYTLHNCVVFSVNLTSLLFLTQALANPCIHLTT